MEPYQSKAIETFLNMLPSGARDVLEIGSDIGGEVVSALAERMGVRVIGLNPSSVFPNLGSVDQKRHSSLFVRADGRLLPFPSECFDAVLSIATLEHVNAIERLLAEADRVLRPKGLFYTSFGPIWSSARGHHVCARVGSKEARFWKPGKNPIPDYAHLLMTSEEMQVCLRSGPCSEKLIEPIIQWVYYGSNINRCCFEEYMEVFEKCSLEIQGMNVDNDPSPDGEILADLRSKYSTDCNFRCSNISVVFRKLPQTKTIGSFMFKWSICLRKELKTFIVHQPERLIRKSLQNRSGCLWRLLRRLKRLILEL